MKLRYSIIILILLGGIIVGCKKAAAYNDVIYFTGTEQAPETQFTIDGPASLGVSVTASTKVSSDITVSIQVSPELLDAYNKLHGSAYQFLPNGSYSLSASSVVIKKGTNVSGSLSFSVTSIDSFKQGIIYCVPITITNVVGGIQVLNASRTIYVLINQTIITPAAVLTGNYFTVPSFQTDPSLASLSNLTLECRVYVSQFQTVNPFISSVIGIEENYMVRFGDVSVANNQLQLAGMYPVSSKTFFATGQWYHVAAVYNGSTASLYVNGVLDNYTDAITGPINLTDTYSGGFHIGFSAGGRLTTGYVSEARVWNAARTPSQLLNDLCYVDPTTKNLIAYWRFNATDANGNVTDLTGHGYTAVANKPVTWVVGVRCPK